jgi:starch synthase
LLAMITRMDPQKGVDLVPAALREIDGLPWQAVLLGSGVPDLESAARQLEADYPGRIRTLIRYDPLLSRRIYAGSDMLLIPSRYEPCGLTQMIAMRYGCIPVARATGGLSDTIVDEPESKKSTGFLFAEASSPALAGVLRRGLSIFRDSTVWSGYQQRGMSQDFSWDRFARQYLELYQRLAAEKKHSNNKI